MIFLSRKEMDNIWKLLVRFRKQGESFSETTLKHETVIIAKLSGKFAFRDPVMLRERPAAEFHLGTGKTTVEIRDLRSA